MGEIPIHWEVKKLKHIAKFRLSNVDKHTRTNEKEVKLCNYTDVYYQKIITENIIFMVATTTEEQIKNFTLEKGDVLITKDSETPDDIAVPAYVSQSLTNVICGYHLAHIKPVSIQGKYLFYAFQSTKIASQFHISATGITRYGIGKSDIGNSLFLIPSLEEQEKIVKFLDRKCEEVENAIALKQRLIELLEEQGAIVINQAVTKGLNPNAPMTDSGIDWLGDIPAHWEVKKLKYMAQIKNGQDYKLVQTQSSESYPVIGSGGKFANASKYLFKGESVLLGRKGTIDKPLYFNGAFWVVDTMFYTVIKNNTFPKFLYYSALNIPFNYFSTNTAVPSMTQSDLNNNFLTLPPIEEQKKIVKYLEEKTAEIEELKEKTLQQIEKLKEFKQILIAEAVTGKIKV